MSFQHAVGYAGDLLATDAYGLLAHDAASTLIDVRTQAEWTYVGAADLQALGKEPLFLEWQSFPSMNVDAHFAARLSAMLEAVGRQAGRVARFPLPIRRAIAPRRHRHDKRRLGALFQYFGRF